MKTSLRLSSILISFIIVVALIGCASTKTSTSASKNNDGASMETAIVVKSVREEYEWVQRNYPGAQVLSQALLSKGQRHYDMLQFQTKDGATHKAYFDIAGFFGKF